MRRESFNKLVSFISLVISAFKWNPKTSGGAIKGNWDFMCCKNSSWEEHWGGLYYNPAGAN